jgi:hypothetical protein
MRKLLCIALLAMAGCAQTEQVWEGGSGNFSMDQGQCQAQAFGVPGASTMQVALVYNSCMRGKGWQLVERPIRR